MSEFFKLHEKMMNELQQQQQMQQPVQPQQQQQQPAQQQQQPAVNQQTATPTQTPQTQPAQQQDLNLMQLKQMVAKMIQPQYANLRKQLDPILAQIK